MKKTKRILCVLLAILLVLPAAVVGSVAAPSGSVTDLAWRTHPYFTNPSKLATAIVADATFGDSNNQALRISETAGDIHAFELVSAEAMKGITAYTVEMDLRYTEASRLGFLLNSDEAANGDWACIWNTKDLGNSYCNANGVYLINANKGDVFNQTPEGFIHLLVKVDLGRETVEVSLWQNDQLMEDAGLSPMKTERNTPATAASGVYLLVSDLEATVDNIKVTNTENDAVLYYEDFESHGRAQVAYVGSQETEVENDSYHVRFLAVLGDRYEYTDYQNVGIKITLNGKTLNEPCKSVYSSVIAGALLAEQTEVTAESKGGKYLMAMTITDIPVSAGELTFTVTPYFETEDGVTEGASYAVTYRAGAFVSSAPIA